MPAPIDLHALPPFIPSNAPEVAGSPWLTDPDHPLHKDHGKTPEPEVVPVPTPETPATP